MPKKKPPEPAVSVLHAMDVPQAPPPGPPKRRSAARTTGGGYRATPSVARDIHLEHHPQSPLPYQPSAETYRCIAFDGGPNTLTYLRVLRVLEERVPGFVDRTHCFAGTSDGAFAAAFLANHARITLEVLDACIEMIEDVLSEAIAPNRYPRTQTLLARLAGRTGLVDEARARQAVDAPLRALSSVPNVARLASGLTTFADHKQIAKIYEKHFANANHRKLVDLPRDLVVVSYAVHAPAAGTDADARHVQKPKVFQNINRNDVDCELSVLDVILRSSALPLFLPIHERHIDGAIFANNPAMCAVAAALANRSDPEKGRYWFLKDLLLLSMGADDGHFGSPAVAKELEAALEHHWGWAKWLGHGFFRGLEDLMLILDVVLNSDAAGVNYQARQLLGRRYLRIAPPGKTRTVDKFLGVLFGQVIESKKLAVQTAATWADEGDHLETQAESDADLHDLVEQYRKKVAEKAAKVEGGHAAGLGRRIRQRQRASEQPVALHRTCSLPEAIAWAESAWMRDPPNQPA